jgi:hypothetical protein
MVGLLEGIILGAMVAVALYGAVNSLVLSANWLAVYFPRLGSNSMLGADHAHGRSGTPGDLLDIRVARSGLFEGQEPLPDWIPQRVQVGLWLFWIQSYALYWRISNRKTA